MSLGRLLVSRIFLIVKIDDFWIEFIECRHVLLGERQPALLRFAGSRNGAVSFSRTFPGWVPGDMGFPGCAPGNSELVGSEFLPQPAPTQPGASSIADQAAQGVL
jgi:hypothetical protein